MAITDPRDISGLVAWYSAEAETSYADGAQMTTWTDQSGNGNHATGVAGSGGAKPLWQATTGPSSGPSVRFQSGSANTVGGYFTLPMNMSTYTGGELLVEIKADTGVSNSHWYFGDVGNASHYPYSGTVYEGFGRTTRYSFTPTLAITSWRRYNVWAATNDFAALLDTTSQSTQTGSFGFPASPRLGSHPAAYNFAGNMSCVVIYNRKLTTTERSDLDAWLQAHPSGGTTATSAVPITAATYGWTALDVAVIDDQDTSNTLDGWMFGGYVDNEAVSPPDTSPPAIYTPTSHDDLALYLPPPTIVNGRIQ